MKKLIARYEHIINILLAVCLIAAASQPTFGRCSALYASSSSWPRSSS